MQQKTCVHAFRSEGHISEKANVGFGSKSEDFVCVCVVLQSGCKCLCQPVTERWQLLLYVNTD